MSEDKLGANPIKVTIAVELDDGTRWEFEVAKTVDRMSQITASVHVERGVEDITDFATDSWRHRRPLNTSDARFEFNAKQVAFTGTRHAANANPPA